MYVNDCFVYLEYLHSRVRSSVIPVMLLHTALLGIALIAGEFLIYFKICITTIAHNYSGRLKTVIIFKRIHLKIMGSNWSDAHKLLYLRIATLKG